LTRRCPLLRLRRAPRSPLFPYTTLFRSLVWVRVRHHPAPPEVGHRRETVLGGNPQPSALPPLGTTRPRRAVSSERPGGRDPPASGPLPGPRRPPPRR